MTIAFRKALSDVGVQAIRREDIPAVIETVGKFAGIPVNDLHLLGSTGKEPISGDIDLAVDTKWFKPETINLYMVESLGEDNHYYNPATKVHSYAVPTGNTKVQVDLMFTPHIEWAKFAYYSDGISNGRTQFKGAIRTILLRAATSFASESGVDLKVYDYGPAAELLINIGRNFDLQNGVKRIYQYRQQRKKPALGESHYLKKMTTIPTLKELQMACRGRVPDLSAQDIAITDPAQALALIFPRAKVTPDDVRTAEQLLDLITGTTFSPEIQKRILAKAKEKMTAVADKMSTIL
jgi:hypothetical protein